MSGRARFVPDAVGDETAQEIQVGDLVPATVAETIAHRERPALQEVLAATDKVNAFQLAGRFLADAPVEDVRALAEAWEHKVDDERAPQNAWKLLLGRMLAFNPVAAFELGARLRANIYPKSDPTKSITWIEQFLLKTWATSDARAALAYASERDPEEWLPDVLGIAARHDMNAALRVLEAHPDLPSIAVKVLEQLAKTDPGDALKRAIAIDDDTVRESARRVVLTEWAKTDADAAMAAIQGLGLSRQQSLDHTKNIAAALIPTAPEVAEKLLATLPEGYSRFWLFERLAKEKAKMDADAALQRAQALPPAKERQQALAYTINSLAAGDPRKLVALLDQFGWDIANNLMSGRKTYQLNGGGSSGSGSVLDASDALLDIARTNPEEAIKLALKLPSSSSGGRSGALGELIREWSTRDIAGYLDWLTEAAPGTAIIDKLQPDIYSLPLEQAEQVAQRLESLEPVLRDAVAAELGRRFAESDPDRAYALADSLADEGTRNRELGELVRSLVGIDLEKSLELFDQLPTAAAPDAASRMLSELMTQSPETAFAWFNQQDPKRLGTASFAHMAKLQFRVDPRATSQWVAELPPSEGRDYAAGSLSRALSVDGSGNPVDYDAARQWAESVDDPTLREGYLKEIIERAQKLDVDAARGLLDSSSLSPETKQELSREF